MGLEQYTAQLAAQEVTPLVLAHMNDDELLGLGIETVRESSRGSRGCRGSRGGRVGGGCRGAG